MKLTYPRSHPHFRETHTDTLMRHIYQMLTPEGGAYRRFIPATNIRLT